MIFAVFGDFSVCVLCIKCFIWERRRLVIIRVEVSFASLLVVWEVKLRFVKGRGGEGERWKGGKRGCLCFLSIGVDGRCVFRGFDYSF